MSLEFFVFNNPNEDKGIRATEFLNILSKSFRNCSYFKKNEIREGFELNYIDFVWEYFVVKDNSLIVFREMNDNIIKVWVYKNQDDQFPQIEDIVLIPKSRKGKKFFCDTIERIFNSL